MITSNSVPMEAAPFSSSEHRATSYVYQPLDHATQSIRLIRLQPASIFKSDVHCDIYHVSLDAQPYYEALSYAWGDATVTSPIFLQGLPFQATVNLVSSLRHLRYEDRARTLWVDAVCIDQSNVQERGHQVAFMAKIYSMATRDILWLGDDPDDEASIVFEFIQNQGRLFENIPVGGRAGAEALRNIASSFMKDAPISALQHILGSRPVWNRVWIVQEIVVSQSVSIYCGIYSMQWKSLQLFIRFLYVLEPFINHRPDPGEPLPLGRVISSWPSAIEICLARMYHLDGDKISILDLWCQFGRLEATDSRDKIFALLGLVTAPPLDLSADYTREASDIFTTVARSIVLQTQNLDSLCMGHKQQATTALPTWVPDFGSYSDQTLLFILDKFPRLPYFASGKTYVSHNTAYSESDPATLILFGVQVDTISKTYSATGDLYTWNHLRAVIRALPSDIFVGQYHTGESMLAVYSRIITGDLGFSDIIQRQSKEETQSLSRDLRSVLSRKGYLKSSLQTLTPRNVHRFLQDDLQRRELKEPRLHTSLPLYSNYKFSTTAKDFMGMIPDTAEDGDILCVLYGSKFPHVLRKVIGKEDTYVLVGIAYIHGLMDGEAIEWRDQGKLKEQRFNLI
jgi:hypothetical protein